MQKYIISIVEDIIKSNVNLTKTRIILPSKRASVFVKNEFKKQLKTFSFSPKIVSIEDFIFDISNIESVDNLVLLFEFYKVYVKNTNIDELDTFEEFSNWAPILIKDFNEIDSYLIDQNNIFSYLKDINRIESWFKKENKKTNLVHKYIRFFEKIEMYYSKFYSRLIQKEFGYQGLQYREAYNKIDNYIISNPEDYFIFIGFNALNSSEEYIIQRLLNNNQAAIYFDLDESLLKEGLSASKFIKNYKNSWKYYDKNPFKKLSNEFIKDKNISIIGLPKNVSQVKYANEVIGSLIDKNQDIAFVLANEDLLPITINSLSNKVVNVNITMGLPLKNINYANFFKVVFKLHRNKTKLGNNEKFYHKDIISLLNHSILSVFDTSSIVNHIVSNNYIFIDRERLLFFNKEAPNNELLSLLFSNREYSVDNFIQLIKLLKKYTTNHFDLEYLNRFEQIFHQIDALNEEYGFITTLDGIESIFIQILNTENISFKGNALQGLQIMGMLETRVLDFETVIITSVNEGFLPSGKSNNSFIPYDVKREKGIPTYQEKDSIFSYHFFRLISRAKNVYLLYNTETDDFGSGEKSRFISQLELLETTYPNLNIKKSIVSPKIDNEKEKPKKILKTESIINSLFISNKKGFSPTALTNYIYNPIAFYRQKVLRIYQLNEVEETIAANTLGTVVHEVLDKFYTPFKNTYLQVEDVIKMKTKVSDTVTSVFKKEYKNGDISKGKNLLIFEISKQFVTNFLNQEIILLKQNRKLKIIDLEVDLFAHIDIEGIDVPIKIFGQADRIDELDGVLRIIDYKTGFVKQTQLNIKNWDDIIIDYKYSKAFQVLMYAYMFAEMNNLSFENTMIESGIISFKNLKSGFMKVNKTAVSFDEMEEFKSVLKQLLSNIFNIEIPFIENENLPF